MITCALNRCQSSSVNHALIRVRSSFKRRLLFWVWRISQRNSLPEVSNARNDDGIDPDDSTLYTERNFYAAFFADLRKGVREIIIVSPFLTASRTQQFLNLFRSKVAEGIEVR